MKKYGLLGFVFIWCILSCNDDKQSATDDFEKIDPNLEIVDSVYLYRIDSTGLTYEITSPKMITTHSDLHRTEEYPEGLDILIHNRIKGESSISCGYAYVDENYKYWFKDNVRIVSEKGDILETSALTWGRTIQTDKLVRLIQMSGDTSYGFGLEANGDFSKFRITNGYAGKVKFEDLKEKLGLD